MEIKNVSRISLASRRTAQQQRDFTISGSVLGKIVVDHQGMSSAVTEILTDGACRVRRQIKHRRRLGGRGRHHDGVIHRAVIFERLDHLRHGRTLLSDCAVDTNQVIALVVDDGIERHGGLARLAVADDQLALAAANRNHGVDRLQTSRHRLAHRLAVNHARRNTLDLNVLAGGDGALVINGLAKSVHHAANHGFTCGYRDDAARTLNLAAFLNLGIVAQDHGANLIFFQVHGDARNAVTKIEQLAGHDLVETINTGDSIAQRDNGANFVHRDLGLVVLNLLAYKFGYFVCFNLGHKTLSPIRKPDPDLAIG